MSQLDFERNRKRHSTKQERRKDKADLWKTVVLKNSIIPKEMSHRHHHRHSKPKLKSKYKSISSIVQRDELVVVFIDNIQEYVRSSPAFDLENRMSHVTMFLKNVLNETDANAFERADCELSPCPPATCTLLASSSDSSVSTPSTASSSPPSATNCRSICCSSALELSPYYASNPLRLGSGRIPSTSEDLADLIENVLYARLKYVDRKNWTKCLFRFVFSVGIDRRRDILADWGFILYKSRALGWF